MNEFPYKYYVTYFYTRGLGDGVGRVFVNRRRPLAMEEDVIEVQDLILHDNRGFTAVIITWWTLLEG